MASESNNTLTALRSLLSSNTGNASGSTSGSGTRRRPPRLPAALHGAGMRNSTDFYKKTLCLMRSRTDTTVPLQKQKLKLYQAKHIIEAVPINLNYSRTELIGYFNRVFQEKLGAATVSIMINVGGKLVAPNLMAGQDLNAIALKEVTKSAKYIYLIPSMTIGHTGIVDDDPTTVDLASDEDDLDDVQIVEEEKDEEEELQPAFPAEDIVHQEMSESINDMSQPNSETEALEAALELVRHSSMTDGKDLIKIFCDTITHKSGGRALEVTESCREITAGKTNDISIQRGDILQSGAKEILAIMEEGEFDFRWPLNVDFTGEESVDLGGPRKEFLRLCLREVKDKLVIDGRLVEKPVFIERKYFYAIGVIIGLSLYQRGPIPRLGIDLTRCASAAEKQMQEGMARVGLMQLLEIKAIKDLVHSNSAEPLTYRSFGKLFRAVMSPFGTSRHNVEQAAYQQFVRYVKEAQAGRRLENRLSPNTILQFATGSFEEPLLGFSIRPTIVFAENPQGFLPTANTCANQLTLPRCSVADEPKGDEEMFALFDSAFIQEYFGKY